MTDIMHMLQQAQAQAVQSQPPQNDSVATFFSSLANSKQSTNASNQSMPIPINNQSQGSFTLESIERNIPKISPPPPQQQLHDTQRNINAGSQQNDLMANSPLAQFISSNNLNSLRGPPPPSQEAPAAIVKASNNSTAATLPVFQQPAASQTAPSSSILNGKKEANKEIKVLITPNMLSSSNGEKKSPPQKQQQQAEPLSKNQLLQAFKYLIDNDNDFTKKIHDAYLKSVNNS